MDSANDERILRHVIATVSPPREGQYQIEILVSVPSKGLPGKITLVDAVMRALRRRATVGATIGVVSQDPEPEVIGHAAGPPALEDSGCKIWYLELFSEVRRWSRRPQDQ